MSKAGRKKGSIPWNKGMKGIQPWHDISGLSGKGSIPWNKGGTFSEESKRKMSLAHKGKPRGGNPENWKHSEEYKQRRRGSGNPDWKGDKVGYVALHQYVKKYFLPKTELCKNCKKVPPKDLANISGEYKREKSDWEWLCRRCHMLKDGRLHSSKRSKSNKKTTREILNLRRELKELKP